MSHPLAISLATRLRDRVYTECVPMLSQAIAARIDGTPNAANLQHAYEQAMTVLFRLLFVAYAEDKDLLPSRTNQRYKAHSLKGIASRLVDSKGGNEWDVRSEALWNEVVTLWGIVDKGNTGWGVPAYNGGLFSNDRDVNRAGWSLAQIRLTDAEFAPALTALLVDTNPADGVTGPVDFRSLSVREFGTIYEGLLESMLSVAASDLTIDRKGSYVPVRSDSADEVYAKKGTVYFHNRSGERKASGSYFTKPFAVEHLLDQALEPALDDHLKRLSSMLADGKDNDAAASFFDFRCVDLSMGSGHFLTAAVDRIEAKLSSFLTLHPIRGVLAELAGLRTAALAALGVDVEIEITALLRRQVARRCVYGVDLNPISVELSRLALWIHTFVPGLALSFLDHNLVVGNALTGIGTLDEAIDILDPNESSLLREQIKNSFSVASEPLRRLAAITDVTPKDVDDARAEHDKVAVAVRPVAKLFDLLVAARIGRTGSRIEDISEATINEAWTASKAGDVAETLNVFHFPVAFPEVFMRERSGFDVILGNPPWEEVTVEELGFWAGRFPGLRSRSQAEQKTLTDRYKQEHPDLVAEFKQLQTQSALMRSVLTAGQFPSTTGDPDLYKAFAWRFWHLLREGGTIGVVLPRSALVAAGSELWRREVIKEGTFTDVTMLSNTNGWIFDDVHPRYTVGLVAIRKGVNHSGQISLRGPYRSLDQYRQGIVKNSTVITVDDVATWSENASFPLVSDDRDVSLFTKLTRHPKISTTHHWKVRPATEFHATNDKHLFDLNPEPTAGLWPVYKGASFNLWQPDTGTYYAWVKPKLIKNELSSRRERSAHLRRSPFAGFSNDWINNKDSLPCRHPRIAFRGTARSTDTRTVIACLVPPDIVLQNSAPYLLFPAGNERDQAYVLGVLCSIPLDWYARRIVETSVNFHVFNGFPIPQPEPDNPIRDIVIDLAGRLAAVDNRYQSWADAVRVPVGSVTDPDIKNNMIARLDAAVAHLYGLTETDLEVIFETFHEGWVYQPRLAAVLKHFQEMS